jgi:hypothetical protein
MDTIKFADFLKWLLPSSIIPLLLLLIAAGIWSVRKRNLQAKEQPQPVHEIETVKDISKKGDGETCEAEYCEMKNLDNDQNIYMNESRSEKPAVTAQMQLAELENDYTCIV